MPKKQTAEVVSKLYSKLKPGGYMYVALKQANPGTPEEEIKKENDYGYEYERFFSYYTMAELEKHFKDLNLEIIYKTTTVKNNTKWLQIIGKK